ncbi:uncharacterized protein LOC123539942 isoform X2 [Mercenaria mercenaria]|uniref:uncharacterized protein LOC123539942 isoform X2 n=1 Tax=Mercenaria mercenaria TaxID=6596 RepID=UPI00234F15F4|nr:uncharacterized protein LOC123539942 isoform X2 [Mercenaria mercenaria]
MVWNEITRLFRKRRESKIRSRSRSRSRFGDMPDVDLYDSVDIRSSPSSKRNSHSSLFRRSGDFSRSPPVVFDNPAYRRSFELRPHRYNSWYDPEATDYSYSQINANLISRKSRSPERRSVSTSRLHDNHAPEHRRHGSSSSWHSSIREYVPKMLHSSSEGDFGQNSPYYHSSQNGLLHNGANSPSQRTLPRTPIEKRGKPKEMRPDFKHSKRSRSYDPDMSAGSGSWEESHFISMDDGRSRSQYIKNNTSKKSTSRGRRDRHKKGKEKRQHDIEIPFDRIYRTNSESRNNHLPIQHSNNSSYKGRSSNIVSSNLYPVSFKYNGPADGYDRNRSLSSSDRSPDVNDYYMGHGRSLMDRRSDNNRRYSNRHSSYKPDSNEIYMFQTKL